MILVPATITAEVIQHANGRPIAYTDATSVVVFVYQEPDGTYVIDIYTRDDTAPELLRLLLDGEQLPSTPGGQGSNSDIYTGRTGQARTSRCRTQGDRSAAPG